MHHHHGRLSPLGDQIEPHHGFAAACGRAQRPEVSLDHAGDGFALEGFQGAVEGEVHLRQQAALIVDAVWQMRLFKQMNQLAGISARNRHSIFSQPPIETQNLFRSAIPSAHALILFPFGIEHLETFRQHLQEIIRSKFHFQGGIDGDLQPAIFVGRCAQNRLSPIQ